MNRTVKVFFIIINFAILFIGGPSLGTENMNSNDITVDFILEMDVSSAWKHWTSEAKLQEWLSVQARVEPKINGAYELFWDPNNPAENSTIGCKVIAIVPLKLLAFEWKGPVPYAELMNLEPLPTWVQINFEPKGISKTIIHFRHSGWLDSSKWVEARNWQLKAWMGAFENLRKIK